MNWAWPAAFAFVGMCAAIAYANVYAPPERDARVVCIEQRGKWVSSAWGMSYSTCDFSTAPVSDQTKR
jgi:hypothetical protein